MQARQVCELKQAKTARASGTPFQMAARWNPSVHGPPPPPPPSAARKRASGCQVPSKAKRNSLISGSGRRRRRSDFVPFSPSEISLSALYGERFAVRKQGIVYWGETKSKVKYANRLADVLPSSHPHGNPVLITEPLPLFSIWKFGVYEEKRNATLAFPY